MNTSESKGCKVLKRWVVVAASILFFETGLMSLAAAQEFSADMVSKAGGVTTQSKIYVSGEKIRMEMKDGIMIVRTDKLVSWMLIPAEKMYMENPIDTSRIPQTSSTFSNEISRVSLGMDTVDGQPAEKFQVTYTDSGKQVTVFQWIRDGRVPVKIEAVDGSYVTEYKNVSLAPQPPDLFEPPAGYEKMTMPSLDFGSMLGQ